LASLGMACSLQSRSCLDSSLSSHPSKQLVRVGLHYGASSFINRVRDVWYVAQQQVAVVASLRHFETKKSPVQAKEDGE
jgi:hypothetical protein